MQIGFDAKRYYHNHTGLGNYSRSLVTRLQEFCPDNGYVLYDEKSWSRTFSLGRKAARQGCQLLHGLSNELPLDIRSAGIASLVTIHDVAWRTFPAMYHWADRHIYDYKYGTSCRNATHVLAISESTRQDIMRFYGIPAERISVIYQPVQDLFYQPMTAEEAASLTASLHLPAEGFVLNVGSINSRKNLLGLVKAIELIPADQRPMLLVVGNGREYKKEVMQYVASHGMEHQVRIETGIHDNHVLQALYTQALCMAYPSFYEGFGLPVVEAALQHCPIVTSNVSSLPEAAGPDATLCDPSDIGSISHALASQIQQTDATGRQADRVEAYARETFDPKSLTIQLNNLYKNII